ncbi:MAG: ATP-binding cassette domain-containing protein, partial [Natronospirillum sp.]
VIPVLVGAAAVLLFALIMQSRMQAVSQESMRASAQRNATLVESLVSLETVRGFQAESRIQNLWERTTAFLSRLSARNRLYSAGIQHFAQWAQHTVAVSVIIVGVYLITQGELTQGGLLAAYLLSSRAMAPISQTAALLAQYHQSATALDMLNNVMSLPAERPAEKQWVSRPNVVGKIEFRNVTFRYPDEPEAALRNISFTVEAGEHVAILGRNGSGKSTVHKLVEGFYLPSEGAILVDGVDLRQFDPAELRRQLGYVPQEVTLFYGSVLDNITLGHPEISVEKLHHAAALSGLGELLDKHPKGYDLPVGERGQLLSGGQRQSVGLARAFVRNPPVLLLDEPTAAMDHSSEEEIKASLKNFATGKTMLLVTHRTSLLDLVDRIIVIDNGAILADGPKEEVVQALRSGQIRRSR